MILIYLAKFFLIHNILELNLTQWTFIIDLLFPYVKLWFFHWRLQLLFITIFLQIVFKHSTVRVLEMCVKYGKEEQKEKIFKIFKGLFLQFLNLNWNWNFNEHNLNLSFNRQRGNFLLKAAYNVLENTKA